MARIKAHQVIPAIVIAAATGIPAAATVEFLNQAPSPAGVGSVAAPPPTTSSPAPTTSSPAAPASGASGSTPSSHKASSPSAVSSIHLPPGLSGDGGGDGGGGDDGGGRFRRYRAPASTPRSSPSTTSSGAAPTGAATHAGALNGNFTGSAVNDPFGTVQTTITVSGGKITSVTASAPMGNQLSAAINQQAVPILRNETLQAQSASVNLVSGATLTSQAYIQSLQSALTQAHM